MPAAATSVMAGPVTAIGRGDVLVAMAGTGPAMTDEDCRCFANDHHGSTEMGVKS
jgi:hypothetical protein